MEKILTDYLDNIKLRSESFLEKHGFLVNPDLPTIEPLEQVSPKIAVDVAGRAFAMSNLTGLGYKANKKTIRRLLTDYNLWEYVTEVEERDLKSFRMSKNREIHYQWLCECIQGLAWCLGKVELDHFSRCKPTLSDFFPPKVNPDQMIKSAKLRPLNSIQQQVDLLYRLSWVSKSPERYKKAHKKLDYNVIAERRRAIEWVYGSAASWEDISLDT